MSKSIIYDTFLSHSHTDADIVEYIASKLEDDHNLKVWLDKWIIVPGEPFIQSLSKGLDEAKTCVVIIGNNTPKGWFSEEIGKALNKQSRDKSFRVIPLLLPDVKSNFVDSFLELRSWVKFDANLDELRPFHELTCGIKGISPGRQFKNSSNNEMNYLRKDLKKINDLFQDNLIDESVKIEFQKSIVQELLKAERNGK
tara:strand:- start:4654 stop:5247 length:594 start_codon:yes stop_codon:yes gene_type:complete